MRLPEEPDNPPQINIVPMVDVIFAILTFFIMSTLYLTRSEGLPVSLPKAATAVTQESTQLTVTIDAQGQLALNRQRLELNALDAQIRELVRPDRPSLVVINADKRVSHGNVITVMDRLRTIPGVKLAIAAEQP